jgi:hypothetical protein
MNSKVVVTCHDESNGEGIMYLGDGDLEDGNITTSWLDFDAPGRLKRLEQLTVVTDSNVSDFKVHIYYRTDDTASWTLATTGNNTQVIRATGLDVDFYKLQIKVLLDDDSGGNCDVRISAINATVTEPN